MTFQTTYRLEIFQRPKGLTQSSPSEMTFKAPLRKSRPWGKWGKGVGVVDIKWNSPDLTLRETFLARFPVSVAASPLVAYGRRRVGLRPTPKIPAAREKNLWYPGYPDLKDMLNCATIL